MPMPSVESVEIRKSIIPDAVPEGVSIGEERRTWEEHASRRELAAGVRLRPEVIAAVPCVWVEDESDGPAPSVMYIHGGGLIAGSPLTHQELASRLVKRLRRRVLLVDYRLAPEHPFPAALHDVTAVYRALVARDPRDSITLGADSTGAALAMAAMLELRDERHVLPAAAFFISGHFDMTLSGASIESRREADPFTSRASLLRAIRCYTNGADAKLPLISPLFADLARLPPMLLLVGDDELLLSDSVRLAEAARRAGAHAELEVWDGMWHVWPMYPELPEADAALKAIARFLDGLAPGR